MKIFILNKYKETPIFDNEKYFISTNNLKLDKNKNWSPDFFGSVGQFIEILNDAKVDDDTIGIITNDYKFSFLSNEMDKDYSQFELKNNIDFIIPKFQKINLSDDENVTIKDELKIYLMYKLNNNLNESDKNKLDNIIDSIIKNIENKLTNQERLYFNESNNLIINPYFIARKEEFYNFIFWIKKLYDGYNTWDGWNSLKNWKKISKSHKKLGEILFLKLLAIYIVNKNIVEIEEN